MEETSFLLFLLVVNVTTGYDFLLNFLHTTGKYLCNLLVFPLLASLFPISFHSIKNFVSSFLLFPKFLDVSMYIEHAAVESIVQVLGDTVLCQAFLLYVGCKEVG